MMRLLAPRATVGRVNVGPAWIVAAAEVLGQTSAARALSLLRDALVSTTGADEAWRVQRDRHGGRPWLLPDRPTLLPPGPDDLHQLAVPVTDGSDDPGCTGWLLLRENPFDAPVLPEVTDALPMIRGLDRHVQLLARLGGPEPVPCRLTPREQVILAALARGCTAQGIAARLGISPRTVHKHQEHLYRKLDAVDRLSAVLRGQELGLLPRTQPEPTWPADVMSPQPPRHASTWVMSAPSSTAKSASSR
jgi:DNA-binding CsgD family transcriptional regulator